MKRKMLSVFLAGIMICLLGGCGGSGQDEDGKKEDSLKNDKEVVTWNTARADDHAIIKAVTACLDAWNETAGTPIEIKFEYIPDRPTQEEKLKTEIAAGDMPTFFDCDPNPYLNQVAKTGQLVNIGELIDEMGIRDNFIPFTLEYQTVDSGLYGFPLECNTEFFFYNKEMFKDAQCEEPKTFDDFLEVCEKLKKAGYTPYAICGADGWPLQRLFSFLPFREAGNDFIDKTIRGEEFLTSDIGMEALEFVRTMGGYFQEGWATMDNSTTQQLFTGGGAAMYYTGSWDFEKMDDVNLPDNMKGNVGWFPLPQVEGGATKDTDNVSHAGLALCVNKEKCSDNVKDFLKFLFENFSTGEAYGVKAGGFIPSTKQELSDEASQLYKDGYAQLNAVETPAKIWDVVQDPASKVLYQSELSGVALGVTSPEDFAKKADATVQENKDEYFGD